MKKWMALCSAAVLLVCMLLVTSLAEDPAAEPGVYELQKAQEYTDSLTLVPRKADGTTVNGSSVSIGGVNTTLYPEAEKFSLTFNGAVPGEYYLAMVIEAEGESPVPEPEEDNLVYVDQQTAVGSGGSGTVTFTLFPREIKEGKTYLICLSGGEQALTQVAHFKGFVPDSQGGGNEGGGSGGGNGGGNSGGNGGGNGGSGGGNSGGNDGGTADDETNETGETDVEDHEKTCPSKKFADVDLTRWYHPDLDYVLSRNIMKGISDTSFDPQGTTNRAMIVTILYRLEGEPKAANAPFTDLDQDWYRAAVGWAAQNGIVKGTSATAFAPGDPITREQFAAILYRYADYRNYDVSGGADLDRYTDRDEIHDYAKDAMGWANAAGLITGITEITLQPAGNATRAQAAAIFHRFCENVAGREER